MNGLSLGHLAAYSGVLAGLVIFGIAYDRHISRKSPAHMQAYVAFYVAFGCLVTLAGAALMDWKGAIWVLVCFVATGLPMMIGAMKRYDQGQKNLLKAAQDDITRAERRVSGDE